MEATQEFEATLKSAVQHGIKFIRMTEEADDRALESYRKWHRLIRADAHLMGQALRVVSYEL